MGQQSDTSNPIDMFKLKLLKRIATTEEFQSILRRVSNILHTSIAVHLWDLDTGENQLLWSDRKFPFCDVLLTHPIGNKKCFIDRYTYARRTTYLEIPIIYKCHAGFNCGIICIFNDEKYNLTLTIGPFIAEEIGVFLFNVTQKWKEINLHISEEEKKSIQKLPSLSLEAVREVLLWAKESFLPIFDQLIKDISQQKGQVIYTEVEKNKKEDIKKYVEDISRYWEQLDKIRMEMFFIALRMKNTRFMEFILKGKVEEWKRQLKSEQEVKFSLYAWIIHGFHFLLIKNKRNNLIENETFLFEKDKLFLKDVSLKTFIKKMIKIIFTSFDKDFFVKDKIKNKFDILYSAIEQELVNGSSFPIIAERMGVKTSALSHWVKRNIGVNYEDLLAYIQVEKIAEYLRNSDKSLAKIGRCIGLRFEPLVSEKFKKITGHSPTDYRNYFYLHNEKQRE